MNEAVVLILASVSVVTLLAVLWLLWYALRTIAGMTERAVTAQQMAVAAVQSLVVSAKGVASRDEPAIPDLSPVSHAMGYDRPQGAGVHTTQPQWVQPDVAPPDPHDPEQDLVDELIQADVMGSA